MTTDSGALANQPAGEESSITLRAGEEAVFDADGNLLSRNAMSREQFAQLVFENMDGQNLLPESHVISLIYQELYGLPNQQLLSILGSDWLVAARRPYPRLRASNSLVVPENKLPKEEEEEVVVVEEEPQSEPEPEPEPIVLTYVCKAIVDQGPSYNYYVGGTAGGPFSSAVPFTVQSPSQPSCQGLFAGPLGDADTNPEII